LVFPSKTLNACVTTSVHKFASQRATRNDHQSHQSFKQLGAKGIRVNGITPGPIWTPLQISGGVAEEKYEKFGSTTMLGRPGQPVELASIYVQLAASDASFATGNIYGSSGGQGQP
jgi:NAD(P)-dependent dehydrogenase (short-subunit alcohol dehydrogenase family)